MSFPPYYLIRISGIETDASIGVHQFEKDASQLVLVSVTLMAAPPAAGDELTGVLDYDFVREGVLKRASAKHYNLQETLCSDILDLCLIRKGVLGAVVQTDKADVYPGVSGVACRMARMGPQMIGFPWWTLEV